MGIDYQDSRDPKWTRAVYDAIVDGTMTLEVSTKIGRASCRERV